MGTVTRADVVTVWSPPTRGHVRLAGHPDARGFLVTLVQRFSAESPGGSS